MGRVSPRRATHFLLLRQEKVSKEKASRASGPLRCATGYLALLASGGVWLNSLRSDNASPDPPAAALLSPAATAWGGTSGHPDIRTSGLPDSRTAGREPALISQFKDPNPNPLPRGEGITTEYRRGAAPGFLPLAVMRRRVAQGRADQGARMFEPAGRVCAHPARPEQRSVPVAKRRGPDARLAFSLLTFSWRSKRK